MAKINRRKLRSPRQRLSPVARQAKRAKQAANIAAAKAKDTVDKPVIFICLPNNSGSTPLMHAMSRSPDICGHNGEGQVFVEKRAKYPTAKDMDAERLWTRPDAVTEIRDPASYDWPAIKAVWHDRWKLGKCYSTCKFLLEKTPSNIARIDMLRSEFSGAKFVVGARNPYAIAEGIRRRLKKIGIGATLTQSAEHWAASAEMTAAELKKRDVVVINYETLINDLAEVAVQLDFELPLEGNTVAKGLKWGKKDKSITIDNRNDMQIQRLTPEEIVEINAVLDLHPELLTTFGYERIG